MNESDLDYYKNEEDYEYIAPYLNFDSIEETITEDLLPEFRPDFSAAIVVDNLPIIPKDKEQKLLTFLLNTYVQVAAYLTLQDICMPINPTSQMSEGFCFIKFRNPDDATTAINATQNLAIDKKRTLRIYSYNDLDKYTNVPEIYVPPPQPSYHPRPDPSTWLIDSQSRDQFVLRSGTDTEIFWSNSTGEGPTLEYGGEREKISGKVWCESYVHWSPQGTYLATYHVPGIKLWGGSDFQAQGRFIHQKVEDHSFSPCENYLITYRFSFNQNLPANEAIIVWDIRKGTKIRNFELKDPYDVKFQVQATITELGKNNKTTERIIRGKVKAFEGDNINGVFTIEDGNTTHTNIPLSKVVAMQEPNRLKWSADGKYVARLGCDIISVYTLPSMALLDKKSISAKDVLDFVWSPKGSLISYWSPAVGNYPAMINIIRIPEREDFCSRKLFDVTDGKMVWQSEGEYLCVHMTKNQGKKRSYVLMFFRVKDHGVPVEQLELNEPILHVSWEPSGDRIVIMYGDTKAPIISFYSMSANSNVTSSSSSNATSKTIAGPSNIPGGTGLKTIAGGVISAAVGSSSTRNELSYLFTIDKQDRTINQCSEILWSPAGGIVILAYFAADACVFEILDVDQSTLIANKRHDRSNKLYWDPSGRYIASCTLTDLRNSYTKGNPDDGIMVFSFQGSKIYEFKREKFYQFAWRPRPKDTLTPEEKKKIIKNLRKYEKMFEKEDRVKRAEVEHKLNREKRERTEAFFALLNASKGASLAMKQHRIQARNGYDSDDDRNYDVEIMIDEKVISSKEQVL